MFEKLESPSHQGSEHFSSIFISTGYDRWALVNNHHNYEDSTQDSTEVII